MPIIDRTHLEKGKTPNSYPPKEDIEKLLAKISKNQELLVEKGYTQHEHGLPILTKEEVEEMFKDVERKYKKLSMFEFRF